MILELPSTDRQPGARASEAALVDVNAGARGKSGLASGQAAGSLFDV